MCIKLKRSIWKFIGRDFQTVVTRVGVALPPPPSRERRVPARNRLYIPLIYIIKKKEKASEHWNDFLVSVSRRNGFPELFIDKYDYTQYTSVQTRSITFSRIKKQYLKAVRATNSEWVINFAFLPFVERPCERTRGLHIFNQFRIFPEKMIVSRRTRLGEIAK